MRRQHGPFAFGRRRFDLRFAAGLLTLAGLLTILFAPSAEALPSFARQTGQPCGACHTDFAGLTPFGRLFKIGGYTMGGGHYRTTLFPSDDPGKNGEKTWVPPISMMSIIGFTHTQAAQPPPTAPFNANDNVVVSPLSFFWGGAITDHIGAFVQMTYGGQPPGGFGGDPFGTHLGLGQHRHPLCQLDQVRRPRRHVRHHSQQQPHRPGPLEYHAGLGFPLRRLDDRADAWSRRDHRRRLCGACRQRRRLVFINQVLYVEASVYHAQIQRAERFRRRSI